MTAIHAPVGWVNVAATGAAVPCTVYSSQSPLMYEIPVNPDPTTELFAVKV